MAEIKKDERREQRIRDEAIVDAHGPEEQAIGWYYYLKGRCQFPFTSTCIANRLTSPLIEGDEVEVVGMAPEEECEHEMFVFIRWKLRNLAVPLAQVEPVSIVDEDTREAIADWHYWVNQGYQLQ